MIRLSRAFAAALLALACLTPLGALAAGTGPTEPCVPGTVWEDLASGVKYICVYDEIYGGSRWEILSSGQTDDEDWLSRSSTYGCTLGAVGLTSRNGSGADAFVRAYRWPCAHPTDRYTQPIGELRARVLVQRYGGSWSTCRDSGYAYNTSSSWSWLVGVDMGAAADCGSGTYRAWGYGYVFGGGLWRGGSLVTPGLNLR